MPGLIGLTVTVPAGVLPDGVNGPANQYPRAPFTAAITRLHRSDDYSVDEEGEAPVQVELWGWWYDIEKVEFYSPAMAAGA